MDEKIKAQVYISERVKREAQIRCIEHRTNLSAAIEALLKMWIAGEIEISQEA